MSSRRVLKAAEAIREVVSMAILTEVRDPRVKNVTVTMVELSPDMKTAKIHVSVMGDAKQEKLSLLGLQNSAGFLQSRLGNKRFRDLGEIAGLRVKQPSQHAFFKGQGHLGATRLPFNASLVALGVCVLPLGPGAAI